MKNITIAAQPKSLAAAIKIGRDKAKTTANQFIFEQLPDRFCAGGDDTWIDQSI